MNVGDDGPRLWDWGEDGCEKGAQVRKVENKKGSRVLAVAKRQAPKKRLTKQLAAAKKHLAETETVLAGWTPTRAKELLTRFERYYRLEAKRLRHEVAKVKGRTYDWLSTSLSEQVWQKRKAAKITVLWADVKRAEVAGRTIGGQDFRIVDEDLVALLNAEVANEIEREREANTALQAQHREDKRTGKWATKHLTKLRRSHAEALDIGGVVKRLEAYVTAHKAGKPEPKRPVFYPERQAEIDRRFRKELEFTKEHDPDLWAEFMKDEEVRRLIEETLNTKG